MTIRNFRASPDYMIISAAYSTKNKNAPAGHRKNC